MSAEIRCPECRSADVIEWDDGYLCRDCGTEFDDPHRRKGKGRKDQTDKDDDEPDEDSEPSED